MSAALHRVKAVFVQHGLDDPVRLEAADFSGPEEVWRLLHPHSDTPVPEDVGAYIQDLLDNNKAAAAAAKRARRPLASGSVDLALWDARAKRGRSSAREDSALAAEADRYSAPLPAVWRPRARRGPPAANMADRDARLHKKWADRLVAILAASRTPFLG